MKQFVDLRPAQLVSDLHVRNNQYLSGDRSVEAVLLRIQFMLSSHLVDHNLNEQIIVPARTSSQLETVCSSHG